MLPELSEIERTVCGKFSLSELEARLKPGKNSGGWSGSSQGGFLAPHESLIEVVGRDYYTLKELGTDYQQMAELAAKVFRLSKTEMSPLHSVEFDRKRFSLTGYMTPGFQSCPWECSKIGHYDLDYRDSFGYKTYGSTQIYVQDNSNKAITVLQRYLEKFRKASDDLFQLYPEYIPERAIEEAEKKVELSLSMGCGGMFRAFYLSYFLTVTELTPHLIAAHHFFEGDASYRTDPGKLWEFVHSGRTA